MIIFIVLTMIGSVRCTYSPRKIIYSPDEYRDMVKKKFAYQKKRLPFSYIFDKDGTAQPESFNIDLKIPPFYINNSIKQKLLTCVKNISKKHSTLQKLRQCVIEEPSKIKYDPGITLDAVGCFKKRKGNCFSLTNLFVGAARKAGFSAQYILIEDIISNNSRENIVVHANHIVCGVRTGIKVVYIDFIPTPKDYRVKTVLSDIEAAGLFYNNLAAKFLAEGDYRSALYLFNISIKFYPGSYQINNNIGTLYLRMSKYDLAQKYYEKALESTRFPDLIYGNLLTIMRRTGQNDKIKEIEKSLSKIRKKNPYFYISLAKEAIKKENYTTALSYLDTARKIKKDIPQVYEFLSKIYEKLDRPKKSRKALEKMGKYTHTH